MQALQFRPVALSVFALLAVTGCGGSSSAAPPAPTISYRTPAVSTPAATVAATPTTAAQAPAAITLTAKNTTFDKTALQATAGKVTIVFMNEDSGTVHNLHVFSGSDAKGQSMGQTQLTAGPVTLTLSVDLTKGTYHYQCDAHPDQMNGTLTVS